VLLEDSSELRAGGVRAAGANVSFHRSPYEQIDRFQVPTATEDNPATVAAGDKPRLLAALMDTKARLVLGGLMTLALIGGLGLWLASRRQEEQAVTIPMVLRTLERGHNGQAYRLAQKLHDVPTASIEQQATAAMVLGLALARDTDERWEYDASASYLTAARYLEEARDLGFPPGYEAEALYQLARCLFLGEQYRNCLPALQAALAESEEHATEIHRMLADAILHQDVPDYGKALAHSTAYLQDKLLTDEQRHAGLIRRSRILSELGRIEEGKALLAELPGDSPRKAEVLLARGRLLLQEARKQNPAAGGLSSTAADSTATATNKPAGDASSGDAPATEAEGRAEGAPAAEGTAAAAGEETERDKEAAAAASPMPAADREQGATETPSADPPDISRQALLDEAIALFEAAQSHDLESGDISRESMYLIGVALAEKGKLQEAYGQLSRVRRLHAHTPEGIAAGLREGDVLREFGRYDEAVVVDHMNFAQAGHAITFSSPYFTLSEFRNHMLEVLRFHLERGEYKHGLTLLESFYPMFEKARVLELKSEAFRDWAKTLQAEAATAPPGESGPLEKQAAEEFRKAGRSFYQLARLRHATREYPTYIWEAAKSYLQGKDYRKTAELLEKYLQIELVRRRPPALRALGEAYLTLGELDRSIAALEQCIADHPRDPATFSARIWAARAYREKGVPERAEELLLENLQGDTLRPESLEWRQSLFALGNLLHAVGRYEDAIKRLEEAIARYPEDEQANVALYLIAESYRLAAQVPKQRLEEAQIESVRLAARAELHSLLESALEHYLRLQETLNRKEEHQSLNEAEQWLLRNCYFSIGTVLFDLGRYEDAIVAYGDATTRLQNDPLVLEVFLQIADCHRRLKRPVEAQGALAQAKVVWKRLPDDLPYKKSTNYTREEWKKLLDLMSSW